MMQSEPQEIVFTNEMKSEYQQLVVMNFHFCDRQASDLLQNSRNLSQKAKGRPSAVVQLEGL